MASNTSQPCRIHCLNLTFSNNLVSRSKRSSEEFEEENQPTSKRWCSSSPCFSSPNNGLEPLPHLQPPRGYSDDSDVDDSLLEYSYGEELLDSPTSLSSEDAARLLADDSETFSCAREFEFNTHEDNLAQTPVTLKEGEKGTHVEPLHTAGSSVCKKTSVCPESVNDLSKGSRNQAGLDLSSKGPLLPEGATVNLEKGNNVPGVIEKGSAQAVSETGTGGERLSVGQASIDHKEPGGENTSHLLGYTGDELDSADSQWKACSVGDKRENHVQVPHTQEPKRPKRICIDEIDLESSKEKYINAVLNHACRREPVIGEVNEMLALMQKVASEYQGYSSQHTTDLTVRNYAQRSKSTTQTFSLSQWVDWNGGSVRRFESVPDVFQRSPVLS
ncbi:hypothetical protein JD844_005176 [Phrynosoma platyrhinos]|uniref:S100P-binding protein n=1 Tax=Phrynosoma platyrhinos TaxID=52577 RepID=A0ABQ7TNQ9_PHRPL|nr:hypothetical protein JD844_005176 [Phrynosoma platyrhinos]